MAPFLLPGDYKILKSLIGKVIRTSIIADIFEVHSPMSFEINSISLGVTENEWTKFDWYIIKSRPDLTTDEEYRFQVYKADDPEFGNGSFEIKFPNGWTWENSHPGFLWYSAFSTWPISSIRIFPIDGDGAMIFEHCDKNKKIRGKWCLLTHYDSAKSLEISLNEEFINTVEKQNKSEELVIE